jgi:hypothetical protein
LNDQIVFSEHQREVSVNFIDWFKLAAKLLCLCRIEAFDAKQNGVALRALRPEQCGDRNSRFHATDRLLISIAEH